MATRLPRRRVGTTFGGASAAGSLGAVSALGRRGLRRRGVFVGSAEAAVSAEEDVSLFAGELEGTGGVSTAAASRAGVSDAGVRRVLGMI